MHAWRFQDDRRFTSSLSAEGQRIYARLHEEVEELRREMYRLLEEKGIK